MTGTASEPPVRELAATFRVTYPKTYAMVRRIADHPDRQGAREALERLLLDESFIPPISGGDSAHCHFAGDWRREAWTRLAADHWTVADALGFADRVRVYPRDTNDILAKRKPMEAVVEIARLYFEGPTAIAWLGQLIDGTELGAVASSVFVFRHDTSHKRPEIWPALMKIMRESHPHHQAEAFVLATESLAASSDLRTACGSCLAARPSELGADKVRTYLAAVAATEDIEPLLRGYISRGYADDRLGGYDTGQALMYYLCRFPTSRSAERLAETAARTRGGYRSHLRCAGLGLLAWFFPNNPSTLPLLQEALADASCEYVRMAAFHALLVCFGRDKTIKLLLQDAAKSDPDAAVRAAKKRNLDGHQAGRIFDCVFDAPTVAHREAEDVAYSRVVRKGWSRWWVN